MSHDGMRFEYIQGMVRCQSQNTVKVITFLNNYRKTLQVRLRNKHFFINNMY